MTHIDSTSRYALRDYVFACISGSKVVLLDLKKDKYLEIEDADALQLSRVIARWPRHDNMPTHHETRHESAAQNLIDELLKNRLIDVFDHPTHPCFDATGLPIPQREITGMPGGTRAPISISDLWTFVSASANASFNFRFHSLERIVNDVASMRADRGELLVKPGEEDFSAAEKAIQKYSQVQPNLWKSKDRCLIESLRLIYFLAPRHIFPVWVFGVSTDPFFAHCWLQLGDAVLNETVETVNGCTPIMAIRMTDSSALRRTV